VHALVQDRQGFIWIGADGGLVRYDGHEFRRWAPELLGSGVSFLTTGAHGEVFGTTASGLLFETTTNSARLIDDGTGQALTGVTHLDVGRDGTLWVAVDGAVRFRRTNGSWGGVPRTAHHNQPIRYVTVAGAQLFGTARDTLWRIATGAPWQATRFPVEGIVDDVMVALDGTVWIGTLAGTRQLRGDRVVTLAGPITRSGPFIERGDTVWASTVGGLLSFRHNEPADFLGPTQGVTSAGALLVDRDGGLWLGTFTSVLYFPEPDAQTWNEVDGLRSSHGRQVVVPGRDDAWFQTWQGVDQVIRTRATWNVEPRSDQGWGALCLDADGRVWTPGRRRGTFARRTPRAAERAAPVADEHVSTCAAGSMGGMWFGQDTGVFHVGEPRGPTRWIAAPRWRLRGPPRIDAVFEDRRRRLWVTHDVDICFVDLTEVPQSAGVVDWRCEALPGAGDIGAFIEVPSGAVWAATRRSGVWRFDEDHWSQVQASLSMDSRTFMAFAPSTKGTIWVAGGGRVTRVEERPDDLAGWREVERLGIGEGHDGVAVAGVAEEADGTVWLATAAGLVRIPAGGRRTSSSPPLIVPTEMRVDGTRRARASLQQLAAGQRIDIHYAVTSYRSRGRLRIAARVTGAGAWIELSEADPTLRLPDLAPGPYRIEARASSDGVRWSATEALSFEVLPPWYRRWWALAGLVGVAAASGGFFYRSRIAVAQRLQQQRLRIARDLHDELGAGLGSIGILAGVASDHTIGEPDRHRVVALIAESASELGSALSDIVWSLGKGPSTLKALAYYLVERGGRLCAGATPVFVTELPDAWPEAELSLVVRRNVMLIVLEGLRNASRHAHAEHIALRLSPVGPTRWRFEVDDDGCGMRASDGGAHRGHGLDNMRQRADEIGAVLTFACRPGEGTRLQLVFDTQRR
jgi:signal transduction histidine kinase